MRGCGAADLKPWAVLSEFCCGFFATCQQQRAAGLRVHQQLEQGCGRGLLQLNRALQPSPRCPVGGGQGAGDTPFEQVKCTGVGRDGSSVQQDLVPCSVLEHLAQVPKQAETGDVGAGVNVPSNGLKLLKQRVLAAGHPFQRSIQVSRLGGAGHGPCKQHSGAEGATDQQGITVPQARFQPG